MLIVKNKIMKVFFSHDTRHMTPKIAEVNLGDTGDFVLNQYYLVKIVDVNLGDTGDFALHQ